MSRIRQSIEKPPADCPLCAGQREWDGDVAVCYFCGYQEKGGTVNVARIVRDAAEAAGMPQ